MLAEIMDEIVDVERAPGDELRGDALGWRWVCRPAATCIAAVCSTVWSRCCWKKAALTCMCMHVCTYVRMRIHAHLCICICNVYAYGLLEEGGLLTDLRGSYLGDSSQSSERRRAQRVGPVLARNHQELTGGDRLEAPAGGWVGQQVIGDALSGAESRNRHLSK